jgi:hypothetical protein
MTQIQINKLWTEIMKPKFLYMIYDSHYPTKVLKQSK